MVIARGKEVCGEGEGEEGKGATNGGGKKLDFGW